MRVDSISVLWPWHLIFYLRSRGAAPYARHRSITKVFEGLFTGKMRVRRSFALPLSICGGGTRG